ncbi:MAG: hypothetical protein Q4G28_08980 [Neisseria sp.]|nr:hypothetical protein [Neisseria sp.]
MKHTAILCSVAALLALGGCNSGMSGQLRNDLSAMTPKERDEVGRKTAAGMQRDKWPETSAYRYKQVSYRAKDDTFVIRAELKNVSTPASVTRSQREQARQQFAGLSRKNMCGNRKVRDLMQYGRYRFEVQVDAQNGSRIFAPVRISAADC